MARAGGRRRSATRDGEALGTVEDVFRSGGGEVLVVTGGPRGEVLVPVVSSIVVEFAPREGRIVVDGEALGLGGARAPAARPPLSRGAPAVMGAAADADPRTQPRGDRAPSTDRPTPTTADG